MPISNQKTTNGESEDFERIITFDGNELAIVDAAVMKALKDTPLGKKPVYVPLKTSVENPSFKIVARYDDATLRKLIIVPAEANEAEPDVTTPDDKQDDISEDAVEQLQGRGGDAVSRKTALPTTRNSRQKRNKLNSKNNVVDPVRKMDNKLGQIGAKTGDSDPGNGSNSGNRKVEQAESRRRSPTPTPTPTVENKRHNPFIESVCLFLKRVKENNLTEAEVRELPHRPHVLETLKRMKARCFGGWKFDDGSLVNEDGYTVNSNSWSLAEGGFILHKGGKNYDFDLIYEATRRLEEVTEECINPIVIDSDEAKLFEELILRRLNLE